MRVIIQSPATNSKVRRSAFRGPARARAVRDREIIGHASQLPARDMTRDHARDGGTPPPVAAPPPPQRRLGRLSNQLRPAVHAHSASGNGDDNDKNQQELPVPPLAPLPELAVDPATNQAGWNQPDRRRQTFRDPLWAQQTISLRSGGGTLPLRRDIDRRVGDLASVRRLTGTTFFSGMAVATVGGALLYENYAADFGPAVPHSMQVSRTARQGAGLEYM
eukprot:SAG22_NODE_101_length_20519_cov_15.588002_17_plen_220_part_00